MLHDALEANHREVPGWLTIDEKALEALVTRLPERSEIETIADEQLIVEFYSK
jgi:ribosomal protein S4